MLTTALILMMLAAPGPPARRQPSVREAVREAMLRTYVHGVDDALARQVLPAGATAELNELLADPTFARRDNVIAFLAHSDRGESTRNILAFLSNPPAGVEIPEEDRALLIAPQALGRIAARGDPAALAALLDMTAAEADGGLLVGAASRATNPAALRSDLLEAALRGLAFSRSPKARERLADIASGRVRPVSDGTQSRDLTRPARESMALFDDLGGAAAPQGGAVAPGVRSLDSMPVESLSGPGSASLTDTAGRVHDGPLTYSNHVAVVGPMTDSRLDVVLGEASLRAGRSDFSGDVSCCATVSRSGTAQSFGSANDGLDIIDTNAELATVLGNSISRVKVVRAINYCGGTGTNIIGCAYVGGFGMALVRLSDLGTEAVVWIHEYGHNTGLNHVTDSRAIMNGVDTGANNGLVQTECNTYHSPAPGAGQTVVDTGVCSDNDLDSVQDGIDDCPLMSNFNQADADLDHIGDVCDPDDDNDGVADVSDCSQFDPQVWSTPGEALNLTLASDPTGTLLSWTAPTVAGGTAASLAYDTLQSGAATNFQSGIICIERGDGPNTVASTGQAPAIWSGEGNQINAQFGSAVASAGDVDGNGFDDVIIGVPRYTNGEDQEGRAYLLPGSASSLLSPARSFEMDFDFAGYGAAVASAGDVNADGYDDIVVGAPAFDSGLGATGSVFVYYGSASGPPSTPSWTAGGDQANAQFGAAVTAGDVNHDGYSDVIVGAPAYDNGQPGEGRVFVYLGSPSGLAPSPTWSASGGQSFARFGAAVAAGGGNIIIGAPMFDNGQSNEGRAFVYVGSPSGPAATPSWTVESDQAEAHMGVSVALGDLNGDGFPEAIVGADLYDNSLADRGRVSVYAGSATVPSAQPIWIGEGDQAGARFGFSVGVAAGFSGDAYGDLIVGAPGYDNGQVDEGRAFVYLGSPFGPGSTPARTMESDQANAQLGNSVAAAGDINGDGRTDVIVGTSLYDNGQTNEGRAQVWLGSAGLQPLPGAVFFYYVRSVNSCGQGPLGFSSDGTPRIGAACP